MYCFEGKHRYRLFEDLGETLGATFWEILGATLDANFGQKNIPTLDKLMIFIQMILLSLSIYIRNILYWATVIQSLKKKP